MDSRDILQLIGVLVAFAMAAGAFVSFVMRQLDKRFAAQEALREEGAKALRETIERYTAQGTATAKQLQKLERDFLEWKAEIPVQYVRREDYIRGQTVLEAKMDALYSKLELVHLKGIRND